MTLIIFNFINSANNITKGKGRRHKVYDSKVYEQANQICLQGKQNKHFSDCCVVLLFIHFPYTLNVRGIYVAFTNLI